MTREQDGLISVGEIDSDNRIDRLTLNSAMVFAHADQPLVSMIDDRIGVAQLRFVCQWLR